MWDRTDLDELETEGVHMGFIIRHIHQQGLRPIPWKSAILPWADFIISENDPRVVSITNGGYLPRIHIEDESEAPMLRCIRALEGSGKTHQIKEIIRSAGEHVRILMLSSRRTFADSVAKEFDEMGFVSYKKTTGLLNDHSRVICSPESMRRLKGCEAFGYVFIDESESVLRNCTSSKTMGYGLNGKYNLETFAEILQGGVCDPFGIGFTKIIALDGNLSMRTVNTLEVLTGQTASIHIHNRDIVRRRLYVIRKTTDEVSPARFVKQCLDNGENLYICSLGAEQLTKKIAPTFIELDHLLYTSETSEKTKEDTLCDVNNFWTRQRVVATTPTTTVGISYDNREHFTRRIIYTTKKSCPPQDAAQMAWRVRHPTAGEDYLFCANASSGNSVPSFKEHCEETKRVRTKFVNPKLTEMHAGWQTLYDWNTYEAEISRYCHTPWLLWLLRQRGMEIVEMDDEIIGVDAPEPVRDEVVAMDSIMRIDSDTAKMYKDMRNKGEGHKLTAMELLMEKRYWMEITTCTWRADLWSERRACRLDDATREVVLNELQNKWEDKYAKPSGFVVKAERRRLFPEIAWDRTALKGCDVLYKHEREKVDIIHKVLELVQKTDDKGFIPIEAWDNVVAYLATNRKDLRSLLDFRQQVKTGKNPSKTVNAFLETFTMFKLGTPVRRRSNGKLSYAYKLEIAYPGILQCIQQFGME